jgi:hypothetical protein
MSDKDQSNSTTLPSTPVATRRDSQRPAAARERNKNFGGPRLKMAVFGSIPGFHLYWENDDQGAIEQLLHEGFEFVTPDEVQMTSHVITDGDIANRVSRYVGRKEDGTPMRAFLLKCDDETWTDREANRYEQADQWDAAIRAGRVQHDSGRYTPKGVNIELNTEFKKSY